MIILNNEIVVMFIREYAYNLKVTQGKIDW